MNSKYIQKWLMLWMLCLSSVAWADLSIGASPAFLDVVLEKGKTSAQTILLFNSGTDPITVRASAGDWWHDETTARKFGPPGTFPHSAGKWVSFSPSQITVTPQKAVNVTIMIQAPEDAEKGNYAVAWFEAVPTPKPGSKELRVGARLGVLIMTEVRGTATPKMSIRDAKVVLPTRNQMMTFQCNIENSGDVHLFPKGTWVIMNSDRKLIGHVGFEKRRMLPGESMPVSVNWADELPAGNYQAILTLDYGESGATVTTVDFKVPKTPPS